MSEGDICIEKATNSYMLTHTHTLERVEIDHNVGNIVLLVPFLCQ